MRNEICRLLTHCINLSDCGELILLAVFRCDDLAVARINWFGNGIWLCLHELAVGIQLIWNIRKKTILSNVSDDFSISVSVPIANADDTVVSCRSSSVVS